MPFFASFLYVLYKAVKKACFLINKKRWSIGIYQGDSPFHIKEVANITNPVLRPSDVNDVNAEFVADPFVIKNKEKYYMFFEVYNRDSRKGDIGLAESSNGMNWEYKKIILQESFHLSYPYVFKWKEKYYLIPESHQDLSVRLYEAESFPFKWKYKKELLSGYHFVDASVIRYNEKWWMFVSVQENDVLNLYFSDTLMGEWKKHPKSPVARNNAHISRPGGRLFEFSNKLFRIAQDDSPNYGSQVYMFEIMKINENEYKEKPVSDAPIIKGSGKGWNADAMHHIDFFDVKNNQWTAIVDGLGKS